MKREIVFAAILVSLAFSGMIVAQEYAYLDYDFGENETNIASTARDTIVDIGNCSSGFGRGEDCMTLFINDGSFANWTGESVIITPFTNKTGAIGQPNNYFQHGYIQNITAENYLLDGNVTMTNTSGLWLCKDSSCTTTCEVIIISGLITNCV
jgi:hypothetical protein